MKRLKFGYLIFTICCIIQKHNYVCSMILQHVYKWTIPNQARMYFTALIVKFSIDTLSQNDWHSKQMHTHNKHNTVNKQVVHMTTTIQRLSNSSTDRTDYLEAVYIILVPRLVLQMLVCLKKFRLKHNPSLFLKA